jgi:hypothetical protein
MNTPADEPPPRYVTCRCQHCNGEIDFEAGYFDKVKTRTVECQHCHLKTRLTTVFPARLIKCPFDSEQKLFWLETSEWFRAHHKFVESVKYDTDLKEKQPLYEAFKKPSRKNTGLPFGTSGTAYFKRSTSFKTKS